jgi:tRNA 2-thiouridine synthesizing protein A
MTSGFPTNDEAPPEPGAALSLDLLGLKCPLPALKVKAALAKLSPGCMLDVFASDPMAAIDIPHEVQLGGDEVLSVTNEAGVLRFAIRKRAR